MMEELEECDDNASSTSSWEDFEEELDDPGESGCHPLLMNSLVLEQIFEFLPIADLLSCRLVSREWNKTVLLRKLLGSMFEITVTKANFDRLLKTAQYSSQPFCRKFDFRLVELEYDKVSKFIRYLGDRVNTLCIKFCSASSAASVIKILKCPRLEELQIYGALPEIEDENFPSFNFTRLRALSLVSSLDYGQVSERFIRIILKHAPNLSSINVGQSMSLWTDFCRAVSPRTCSKLCHVGLSGIEGPIEDDHFGEFRFKHLIMERIHLQNCLVSNSFLEQLLQRNFKQLAVVNIEGTQQEILSRSFQDVNLPNLQRLILPIDGMSLSEGCFILQSSPNIKCIKLVGLFQTQFTFKGGQITSLVITEPKNCLQPIHPRDNLTPGVAREFLKVIALFPLQPRILDVNLQVSQISSRCIRKIFQLYPDLEHFTFVSNSAKECIVGFTGIPYRFCRKMATCKSFSVPYPKKVRIFPSAANLKRLKSLHLTFLDEAPSAELTLLLIIYGISEIASLEELNTQNLSMSDVSFITLAQRLHLSACRVNGSPKDWQQFLSFYEKHTIKSFLLPPTVSGPSGKSPAEVAGLDRRILLKTFKHLSPHDVFECRTVCKYWQALTSEYLHQRCRHDQNYTFDFENRINDYQKDRGRPASPSRSMPHYIFGETRVPALAKVLRLWSSIKRETTLVIVSLNKAALDFFQIDNIRPHGKRPVTCQKRRQLEYWYYPDGTDQLIYTPTNQSESGSDFLQRLSNDVQTLIVIGSWGKRDVALLEFFNPSWSISSVHMISLQKEVLDLILPKLTAMMNIESLSVDRFSNTAGYCELGRTHLQILCNSSFKLKRLHMQLYAPPETIVEFVRSQRFTLETVELRSNVNISDRLTFLMPQLKVLLLDEPPGCLLWSTLHVHSSLETINFGRSSNTCSPVKNKASPKFSPVDADFEHSATELLCDINWFLENTTRTTGAKKSILQQGSDFALKFFTHFPYLSSLTLRSVHAHYGILQGIFKKFGQLKKLELISATGVTDEILTGFSSAVLDEMDVMNPFQLMTGKSKTQVHGKGCASIRNLKCLTYLSLDDQPLCTDLSVIFGILKLQCLEFFSCKKWKITDVALRALTDILPNLKEVNTQGCLTVSKFAIQYFEENRSRKRTISCSNPDSHTAASAPSNSSDSCQKTEE